MSVILDQEQVNSEYLARGLDWLRRVLQAPGDRGISAEPWWDEAMFTFDGARPALEVLASALGLTRFEMLTLLLCASPELDPSIPELCMSATGDPGASAPTFALALSLLPDARWDVVSSHRPLRYWRLLEVQQDGRPLTTSPLRPDERVVNFIKGLNELDEGLAHWLGPLDLQWETESIASHAQVVAGVVRCWQDEAPGELPPVAQLIGPDERVRKNLAVAAASQLGLRCHELHVTRMPTAASDLTDLIRLLNREAKLLPAVLYVDAADLSPQQLEIVSRVCGELAAPLVLGGIEPCALAVRRTRIIDAGRPTAAEQHDLWVAALGPENEAAGSRLADHFDLDPATIRDCARTTNLDAGGVDENVDRLWDFCRDQARPSLAALATRIEPRATWHDLVLADAELAALHQLADQVRGRPKVLREWGLGDRHERAVGVAALFAGQSGTGKTLAAEVLANDLRLTLCRIDLSGVVSKYIGETERNLRRVFDAAERGGALLFFDEADALFGKRSEVRDSHDRYANIEVNYLLQRMETFQGLAILATNQRQALDNAFTRRLRMVITFPFPTAAERRRMWLQAFPSKAPTARLDVDRLAELPATGAMIRNIAWNAAMCAAGRSTPIDMELVLEMARAEFTKLDLPLPHTHFAAAGRGR